MTKNATTEKIRDEFILMLEIYPYPKISVKAIAERLGMSRQNIYRNYASKEEIMAEILQDKFDEVFDFVSAIGTNLNNETWKDVTSIGIEILYQNKRVVCAIINSDEAPNIYRIIKAFLVRCMGHIARIYGIKIRDTDYFDSIASYIAGGGYHLIKSWAKDDMRISPDKIALVTQSVLPSALLDQLKLCE
jgi:AcrR family transcriptional regulator